MRKMNQLLKTVTASSTAAGAVKPFKISVTVGA